MKADDHKHMRKREPRPKKIKRCPIAGCGYAGRNLTEHLATEHGVPLVMLGQGEYTRTMR